MPPYRGRYHENNKSMPTSIFISAGEASGEQYGALLIDSIRQHLDPKGITADIFGMGGPRMVQAGLEPVVRAEDMAVMGVTEVIRHLPRIYGGFRKLRKSIRNRRPSVAVLIDFPDVHLKLAEELHRLDIPVIYFVSPQLWAWKKYRVRLVRQFVDRMLVIFPFEEAFYSEHGVEAEFVGHPLAELPLPAITREQFAQQNGLKPTSTWIALLPGSRFREIRHNLPEMLEAARQLALRQTSAVHPSETYEFPVPLAPTLNTTQRAEVSDLVKTCGGGLPIRIVDDARAALRHARAAVVASGTATVEAALIGNPFVVVYRVSPLTYAVAKRVVNVPHVAMANLIAGKRLVPELIQHDFTASNIVKELELLLPDGPARQSMMQELEGIRTRLTMQNTRTEETAKEPNLGATRGSSVMDRVASIVLEQLQDSTRSQSSGHDS